MQNQWSISEALSRQWWGLSLSLSLSLSLLRAKREERDWEQALELQANLVLAHNHTTLIQYSVLTTVLWKQKEEIDYLPASKRLIISSPLSLSLSLWNWKKRLALSPPLSLSITHTHHHQHHQHLFIICFEGWEGNLIFHQERKQNLKYWSERFWDFASCRGL